jgi:hypothetical protein
MIVEISTEFRKIGSFINSEVGSSEIWILGQRDELQALKFKYPTIQHPSFSRTRKIGVCAGLGPRLDGHIPSYNLSHTLIFQNYTDLATFYYKLFVA